MMKKHSFIRSVFIPFLIISVLGVMLFKHTSFAAWIEEEDGVRYQQADGQYAIGFVDIEEKRYYFDKDGYLMKGKFYVPDEEAYYFSDDEGVLQYGIIKTDKDFYIAAEDGRLKTGFVVQGNQRYYFNDYAQIVTGWFKYEDDWYYADNSGVIMTGFILVDGYRYYLNDDGTRVSETVMDIDGVTYFFNKDGSIDENATTLYPVFEYLNQIRAKNGTDDLLLNTKVQACAILRASELENGFQTTDDGSLERLLKNRGVKCAGGYEFSYGGISEYDIDTLIQSMEKDRNLISVLKEESITEVGLGLYVKNDILYYDIIFITGNTAAQSE